MAKANDKGQPKSKLKKRGQASSSELVSQAQPSGASAKKRKAMLNLLDMNSSSLQGVNRKKAKKLKHGHVDHGAVRDKNTAMFEIEGVKPIMKSMSQSHKITAALTAKKKKLKSKKHTSDRQLAIDKKQKSQQVTQAPDDLFDVPEFIEEIETIDLGLSDQSDDGNNDGDESEDVEVVEKISENDIVSVSDEEENNETETSANLIDMDIDNGNIDMLDFLEPFEDGIWYRKLSTTCVLVHLRSNTSLAFTGKAIIHVMHGVVEICGHKLFRQSKPCEVYCPQPSSLLSVQAIPVGDESHLITETNFATRNERQALLRLFRRVLNKRQLERLENSGGATLILEGFETEWSVGFRHLLQKQARHVLGDKMVASESLEDANSEAEMEFGSGGSHSDPFEGLGLTLYSQPKEDSDLHAKVCSEWNHILDSIISNEELPRIGVFGGQNSGKSSLTKWMTNKMLNQTQFVLYIDLDPGQPEFTPPGMISAVLCESPVLGPNYTHLVQPLKSIFIGSTNVADSPVSYWSAVQQLWNFISKNKDLKNVPWTVNTMGFARGLGVDLTCEIVKLLQLNSVIQLDLNRDKSDYPFELTPINVAKYRSSFTQSASLEGTRGSANAIGEGHSGTGANSNPKRTPLNYSFFKINSVHYRTEREPVDIDQDGEKGHAETMSQSVLSGPDRKVLREYTILSYFANALTKSAGGISAAFESVVPYMVPLRSIKIGLENLNPFPSTESILRTMNANLVALCSMDSSTTSVSEQEETNFVEYKNLGSTGCVTCIGYGIVRAIDLQQQLLYILTPIAPDVLQASVNCIIPAGNIGVPVQLCSIGQARASTLGSSAQGSGSEETPYIMNPRKHRINSRLHSVTKKFFVPNRVAAHNVLRKCLL